MYQKNKQEINANVKYGQVNRPYKKWIQRKSFMASCITTLIIFVLCSVKFSPHNKSSCLQNVFCTSMLDYFAKVADCRCFPVYFQ